MIDAQLAVVTTANKLDSGSVHFFQFTFAYADVIIDKEVMPCFVEFGTWFTSIRGDFVQLAIVRHLLVSNCARSWCYIIKRLAKLITSSSAQQRKHTIGNIIGEPWVFSRLSRYKKRNAVPAENDDMKYIYPYMLRAL